MEVRYESPMTEYFLFTVENSIMAASSTGTNESYEEGTFPDNFWM